MTIELCPGVSPWLYMTNNSGERCLAEFWGAGFSGKMSFLLTEVGWGSYQTYLGINTWFHSHNVFPVSCDSIPSLLISCVFWRLFYLCECLFMYMYVHQMCAWCCSNHRKVLDTYESSRCLWATTLYQELNPGPLDKQQMVLTSEPSLQPPVLYILKMLPYSSYFHWSATICLAFETVEDKSAHWSQSSI